ncbi:MLX-interacting [Podospora conica]|nr:MLX-interacting [Schizothecium conicum]
MSLSDEVSSPNGSDSKKLHAPLTEEEKKRRHILSEQKRRGNIRQSFDRLTTIVPDTEGRGRSEMFVLNKTDGYLRDQLLKRKALIEKLEERGITVDEKDKE